MFDNNTNRSDCSFTEAVVSYIYGELEDSEVRPFEEHLETCRACSAETESFRSLSGAIGDWKAEEFDSIATPSFTIPVANPANEVATAESEGFLERLRGLFALPTMAVQGAAAAVVMLLLLGLGWVYFSGLPGDEGRAGVEKESTNKQEKDQAQPVNNTMPEPELAESKNEDTPTGQDPPVFDGTVTTPRPIKASSTQAPKKRKKRSRKSIQRRSPKTPTVTPQKPQPAPVEVEVKRLTVLAETGADESLDEGLRLSDLFEDSEADEGDDR